MPTLSVTNVFSANTLIKSTDMNQNFTDVQNVVNALTSVNYAALSVNTASIANAAVTSLKGGLGIDTSGSAQGGVPYLNGVGTWAILVAGTANQLFKTGGASANPSFTSLYTVRAFNSAAISISNNTITALTFDSERFDTDTMHSTVTNTGRLTATTAGKYLIIGNITYAANATGVRGVDIFLNGATLIAQFLMNNAGGVSRDRLTVSTIYNMAATDYVELRAFQTSGGALNVDVESQSSPEFMMAWVGV